MGDVLPQEGEVVRRIIRTLQVVDFCMFAFLVGLGGAGGGTNQRDFTDDRLWVTVLIFTEGPLG